MKMALREKATARRAACVRDQGDIGPVLARHMAQVLDRLPGTIVAGYHPIRTEANVLLVLEMMADQGWQTALPVVVGPGEPLEFQTWVPGEALNPGAYDVRVPAHGTPVVPDVVLVPLLAYDRAGHRLGYGGGFYDRTLAALRLAGKVTAIGVAYAGQQVDVLLAEGHDAPLDGVLTEQGTLTF